jgi:hypothetical protein
MSLDDLTAAADAQLSSTEGMTQEEIVEAVGDGRLDHYLATRNKQLKPPPKQRPVEEILAEAANPSAPSVPATQGMTQEEIVEAVEAGELHDYMTSPNKQSGS